MKIGFDYIGVVTPFYCHDGRGNLLLHKRSTNCRDEHGAWDPGSGKLEWGITLQENVLKELMEEYGCKGEIQDQLPAHDVFRIVEGKKVHWVVVPFFIKVNPDEVKINEPDKMDEIGWFTIDTLPPSLSKGFEYSFKYCNDYFQKYLGNKK